MAKMSFDLFGALSPNDGESKVRMALFLIKRKLPMTWIFFLIKCVPFSNNMDLIPQVIGEDQKKTDNDNEEVTGVPEQVD